MSLGLMARLSLMMFLQYAVWGSWYVTVGNYMAALGMTEAIYWAYTVGPISGVVAPFFLGFIADRFFASERVLAALNFLGAIPLFLVPHFGEADSTLFIGLLLLHTLFFFPTLGLTTALAFHHVVDREQHFPRVRVFGTLGWVVAGVVVSGILSADATALPLQIGGCVALVASVYSLTLPHTPPRGTGKVTVRGILGIDALQYLRSRPFVVYMLGAVMVASAFAVYYAYTPIYLAASNVSDPAFKMSFGQLSEVVIMVFIPFVFRTLGIKRMLLVGLGAWILRYVLFILAAPDNTFWMLMGGILLHGVCFNFIFISGQIYVDRKATPAIRAQAQGLLVMVQSGIGLVIGSQFAGFLFNSVIGDDVADMSQWQQFWWMPLGIVLAVVVLYAVFFKDDSKAG